ncbi:MAG TPA: hypothetical protein PKV72_06180, partial [Candidatus Peribacteria bacterium]|nr:hypothetical protein [Candidatus Peribacteria bacterium]
MSTRAVSAALFLLALVNCAYVAQIWGANQESRLSLMYAMIVDHTLDIDDREVLNIDKAEFNGHFYSDKAPAVTFLALPAGIVGHLTANALRLPVLWGAGGTIVTWIARTGSAGLLAALGTVAMWLLLLETLGRKTAAAAALALMLGTLQLPYSTQLFSHALTMGLLSISLLLLHAARPAKPKNETLKYAWKRHTMAGTLLCGGTVAAVLSPAGIGFTVGVTVAMIGALWLLCAAVIRMHGGALAGIDRDLIAGLACGLAVTGEYVAAVAAAGLFVLAVRNNPRRAVPLVLGALCPLLLFAKYNWLAFGSPLSIGYQHNGFAWMQAGVLGLSLTFSTDALQSLLISQTHGLFFWSPFLLLALPGYRRLWSRSRPLFWLCLGVPLATLMLLCTMGSPYGGAAVGPRYLAPAIPFLVLAAAEGLASLPRFGRALILVSVALTLMATLVDPIVQEFQPNPFVYFYLLRLAEA